MLILKDSPPRQELNKNFLDQVILRFDFPIIFGLADTDNDGRLVTARKSELLEDVRNLLVQKLPIYQPVEPKTFNFDLAEGGAPKLTEIPNEVVHTFRSKDGNQLCEVSINSFVFVSKGGAAYTNFEAFIDEFWLIWEKMAQRLKIPTITKVGLRKINLFPYSELPDGSLDKAIRSQFLPPFQITPNNNPKNNFIGRQTFEVLDSWMCNFQFGIYPKPNADKKVYFFDTDIFRDDALEPNDIKMKLAAINTIHWQLYCQALTSGFFEKLKVVK